MELKDFTLAKKEIKKHGKRVLPLVLSAVMGAGVGAKIIKDDADEAMKEAKTVINGLSNENEELLNELKERKAKDIESVQFHCLGVTLEKGKNGEPIMTLNVLLGKPPEATINSIPVILSCPFNSIESSANESFRGKLEEDLVAKTINISINDTLGRAIVISFTMMNKDLVKIEHKYPSDGKSHTGFTEYQNIPPQKEKNLPPKEKPPFSDQKIPPKSPLTPGERIV